MLINTIYQADTEKLQSTTPRFWDDISYQRTFVDDLLKQLEITTIGWHKLTRETLQRFGGQSLLIKYNNSLSRMLKALYPEYPRIID